MKWVVGQIGFFMFAGLLCAQQISSSAISQNISISRNYTVVSRDANSRVWQRLSYSTNANGQTVTNAHSYTELATGLNHLVNGQWVESKEEIDPLPNGGAAATNGQHQVYFPADIYNGKIELVTPAGEQLLSQPSGLNYFDGTNFVILGVLTNSIGELVSSNQIIYPDAFNGIKADLRYTYTKAGFEQDIILKEQPLTPESFGLNPDRARLEVLTEFFNSPQPAVTTKTVSTIAGKVEDDSLNFGAMRMKHGKAFLLGTNSPSVSVNKQWLTQNGRQFLVEAVPVNAIVPELLQLPVTQAAPLPSKSSSLLNIVSAKRLLPAQHLAKTPVTQLIPIARADAPSKGLVLDYVTVDEDYIDYTFASGTTYYIPYGLYTSGSVTLEAGTVIKMYPYGYGDGAIVMFGGAFSCTATADSPAIFTSYDDNSVGEPIGSGSPFTSYNGQAIIFDDNSTPIDIEHVRFYYSYMPVLFYELPSSQMVRDCQFINDTYAIASTDEPGSVENCLFYNVDTVFDDYFGGGISSSISGQNLTIHHAANLQSSSIYNLTVKNSLFICVTNWGNSFTSAYNRTNSSDSGIFQTAGNATHYLATSSSYRNIGTTSIDSDLLTELGQTTTYAPQDGGYLDTDTPDLGYHYSTNEDSDYDGLPDSWEWKWFGSYSYSGTNLDGTGDNTLGYDYANNLDPNVIQFSFQFTNDYVNVTNVPAQLNISGGVPFYVSVLVNDTDITDAVWHSYTSSNIVAALGSTNGTYMVYVGLRGLPSDATQTWKWATVTLYADAPLLTLTNPIGSVVSNSSIQLQGYASHALNSLTFDVSNSAGIFTNQEGFLTGQFYNTNLLLYTTNYFECDVDLDNGTNRITLHATDWAGNVTNVNVTLDYSVNTNPPMLSLIWPQAGAKISGSNFTLQAQVSDPMASITASMVYTNGDTNIVQGLVEQNGSVWVKGLMLSAGTNAVTLTASNIFGGVSTTNFNVVEYDVGLTVDPISDDQLNQASVNVTGSVNDSSQNVWVNGVEAYYVDDFGDWEADGVPVNPTGTAGLDAQVTDSSDNPVASQTFNQPQPAMVVLAGYSGVQNIHSSVPGWGVWTINWAYDSGGRADFSGYDPYNDPGTQNEHGGDDYTADGPGFATPDFGADFFNIASALTWDYFSVNTSYQDGDGHTVCYQRSSQAQVMIAPSGQQQAGTTNVYLVLASASEFSDPVDQYFGEGPGDVPLPPEWLKVQGQTLINTGITNIDGEVLGATLVSGKTGVTVPLNLKATEVYQNQAFTFNAQAMNFRLTVVSNSAVQINGTTNWATVKTTTNDYVTVQAMVGNASHVVIAALTNVIQWSGGVAVPGNPLQRWVSKTNSVETTVSASVGSMTNNLNVWIVWADLTIKTSGALDSDDKAAVLDNGNFPTPQSTTYGGLGLGGGNNLGPIDRFSNTNLNYAYTIGKMEAKAVLQPIGIGNFLTNNWNVKRTAIAIAWDNGGLTYTTGGTNPPSGQNDSGGALFQYLYPINGDIFDLDWPGCPIAFGASPNHTSEVYDNFYEYVTVNLGSGDQLCSATNTYSYKAQIDFDATTNNVQLNSLSTPLITLPTTPHYTQR